MLPEGDPSSWAGDAKLAGLVIEVTDRDEIKAMLAERGADPEAFSDSHFYKADIREVVMTRVDGDSLLIELWRPGQALSTTKR